MARSRLLRYPDARSALDQLHGKGLNFDVGRAGELTPANGWRVDHYRQPLPPEPPGPPLPGGSFAVARRLVNEYEFADPSIIRAIYHPDEPLEQRDLLLEARFYGLRFYFGVRVGGVHDDSRDLDGCAVRIWGWSYRTLQGHLEMGQMDYDVLKWLDTGEVEFRISRFSRAASIPNPLVRLGFHLFGRHEQVRFARRACTRMARLVAEELAHEGTRDPVSRAANHVDVVAASEAGAPRDRLARQLRDRPGSS